MSSVALHRPARAPDQRRRRLRIPLLVLAVLGVSAWAAPHAARWVDRTVLLPVRDVKVDGTLRHVDRGELRSIVTRHLGRGLLGVDLGRLRGDLGRLPWVQDVAVRRVLPDTLLVHVTEHQPVARWNERQLLGADGRVFGVQASADFAHLPLLVGPHGTQRELHRVFEEFSPQLRAAGLQLARARMDARRSLRLTVSGDVHIELGRYALRERLARFLGVYRGLLRVDWPAIERVDLRYTNGLAVGWRSPHGGDTRGAGTDNAGAENEDA